MNEDTQVQEVMQRSQVPSQQHPHAGHTVTLPRIELTALEENNRVLNTIVKDVEYEPLTLREPVNTPAGPQPPLKAVIKISRSALLQLLNQYFVQDLDVRVVD